MNGYKYKVSTTYARSQRGRADVCLWASDPGEPSLVMVKNIGLGDARLIVACLNATPLLMDAAKEVLRQSASGGASLSEDLICMLSEAVAAYR